MSVEQEILGDWYLKVVDLLAPSMPRVGKIKGMVVPETGIRLILIMELIINVAKAHGGYSVFIVLVRGPVKAMIYTMK